MSYDNHTFISVYDEVYQAYHHVGANDHIDIIAIRCQVFFFQ